jgi:hypothetical protein
LSSIRITIGGQLDRSVRDSFAEFRKLARDAGVAADRDLNRRRGGGLGGAAQNPELAAARAAHAEQSRLNRDILRQQLAASRQVDSENKRLARDRTRLELDAIRARQREERNANREKEHDERRLASAAASLNRQRSSALYRQYSGRDRELDRLATRTSHRATRFIFPRPEGAIGYATRTANDLMRGVGVDMSLGGGVQRAVARDTAAMGLAQQEQIATGKTRGTEGWKALSQNVGKKLTVAPEQVTELIRSFTGLTGDFDAAAQQAEKLASMTLASGANMGQMGDAAGYVYNQLQGMPGAADMTLDVMRHIVGQTAMGAVEMADYAKQMGRVAANAKMFKGDVKQNIVELSALTQLAVSEGGATSGADAARGTVAFANTTSKGARINAFKSHGINLFEPGGQIKRPMLEIIGESFVKTKGNIPELTKMWADTLGQKPLRALLNSFNTHGGGAVDEKERLAAWDAAKVEKLDPFMKTQLTPEQEKKNLEERAKTTAIKAEAFQLKLDVITDSLTQKLLPALEKLAPDALKLADTFSSVASWVGDHLGQALAAAVALSVVRANLESVFRAGIDRAVKGLYGGSGGPSGGQIPAGGALSAFTLGAATFAITNATLNVLGEMRQKESERTNQGLNEIWTTYQTKKTEIERSNASPVEKAQQVQGLVKQTSANIDLTMEPTRGIMSALPDWAREVFDSGTAIQNDKSVQEMQKRLTADQSTAVDAIGKPQSRRDVAIAAVQRPIEAKVDEAAIGRGAADGLKGQTIKVYLTNAGDINSQGAEGGPKVSNKGRRGPGA